jgi:hypothetical protein
MNPACHPDRGEDDKLASLRTTGAQITLCMATSYGPDPDPMSPYPSAPTPWISTMLETPEHETLAVRITIIF